MSTEATIRAFVRGDEAPDVLEPFGIALEGSPGQWKLLEPGGSPSAEVSFADLAVGLARHWALGTRLAEWAATVLMSGAIDLPEAESPDENRLLQLLWSASAGEVLTDGDVLFARLIADDQDAE